MDEVDQYQTELFLHQTLVRGDKSKLAEKLGVTLSEISQQCNPAETARKSYYYQFKRFLTALKAVNPRAHELLLADLHSTVDTEPRSQNLSQLVADASREHAELIGACLEAKPASLQLKEALETQVALSRVVKELNHVARKGAQIAQFPQRKAELRRKTR